MAKRISSKKPTTKVTLIESVIHAWHHVMTEDELEKLQESMSCRCRLVIMNKGCQQNIDTKIKSTVCCNAAKRESATFHKCQFKNAYFEKDNSQIDNFQTDN